MTGTGAKTRDIVDKELYMVQSCLGVEETIARVRCILQEKMIPVFFVFDHTKAALEMGLKLRPTVTIMFGSPAMRTRLLQAEQRLGILLPLRMLVWEDAKKRVWVGYVRIAQMARRYGVKNLPEIAYLEHMMENISHRACHPAKKKSNRC